MRTNNITPDEVLDSRDIIDRAQELIESYLPTFNEHILATYPEAEEIDESDALHDEPFLDWLKSKGDDEEALELIALIEVWRECENYSDWSYGEVLIRDDYFTDYTTEMLKDCGYIPHDMPSWIEIDYEATADNVKVDYSQVEFMDNTYWIRNC
jgi:hypothetical protein